MNRLLKALIVPGFEPVGDTPRQPGWFLRQDRELAARR
jgi:hypothetical protein